MSVAAGNLLLVDDDEMNRDMLSRRLRRGGYDVTVAADGRAALDLVAGQQFDLVVLDVTMPGIDGLQTLQTLRKSYSLADLPVIMATARDGSEDVVHALQLGANDYVTKPIDVAILLARVGAQLNLKRARLQSDAPAAVTSHAAATTVTAASPPLGPPPEMGDAWSIGRYQTVKCIGSGGMGAVYLARDPLLDRPVAIKLLPEPFDTAQQRQRFSREARAAARLTHRNIVTVYDVGEHDGCPFIAMEFVPGETLADHISRQTMPLERRLGLAEQLCDGLAHAHRAGIVHRDIKPANLMLTPAGVLKIVDFGIARLVDVRSSGLTQANTILGTVNYMAPEQFGGDADHLSDGFSVGAVFYELLSGSKAFPGTARDGVIQRILVGAPAPLQRVCPGLDQRIIEIVDRALQKSPADRYPDLETMRRDVAAARERLG